MVEEKRNLCALVLIQEIKALKGYNKLNRSSNRPHNQKYHQNDMNLYRPICRLCDNKTCVKKSRLQEY